VAGCFECGDEPYGSCATELVSISVSFKLVFVIFFFSFTYIFE
jgi:hypothetical protein